MSNNQNKATAKALAEVTNLFSQLKNKSEEITKSLVEQEEIVTVVRPEYLNPKFESKIKLPRLFRYNERGSRYYFSVQSLDDISTYGDLPRLPYEELVTFYPSVTTVIDKTTPLSYGLKKLIGDLGMDGFYKMMKQKAHYGTLLHILIADYLRSGNSQKEREFDLDDIAGRIALYSEENNLDFDLDEWTLKKDFLALHQFIIDHEVDPIAIEVVGTFEDGNYRFAGAIDLICEMTIEEKGFHGEVYKSGARKGEPKETKKKKKVTAVVDFKSGKSGFFTDHEIQLHMYKLMAEHSMDLAIDKVFNVAPRDWRDSPTFSIKDQTDSIHSQKIPHLLRTFAIEWEEPKSIMTIGGKVNGVENEVVKSISAAEYVFNHVNVNNS